MYYFRNGNSLSVRPPLYPHSSDLLWCFRCSGGRVEPLQNTLFRLRSLSLFWQNIQTVLSSPYLFNCSPYTDPLLCVLPKTPPSPSILPSALLLEENSFLRFWDVLTSLQRITPLSLQELIKTLSTSFCPSYYPQFYSGTRFGSHCSLDRLACRAPSRDPSVSLRDLASPVRPLVLSTYFFFPSPHLVLVWYKEGVRSLERWLSCP